MTNQEDPALNFIVEKCRELVLSKEEVNLIKDIVRNSIVQLKAEEQKRKCSMCSGIALIPNSDIDTMMVLYAKLSRFIIRANDAMNFSVKPKEQSKPTEG